MKMNQKHTLYSTLQQALSDYEYHGQDFWKEFEYHTKVGMIFMNDEIFAMMRPCKRDDPFRFCFRDQADAWYVSYVNGDGAFKKIVQIAEICAPEIDTVCFTRSGDPDDIRFYKYKDFKRLTK